MHIIYIGQVEFSHVILNTYHVISLTYSVLYIESREEWRQSENRYNFINMANIICVQHNSSFYCSVTSFTQKQWSL